MQLSTFPTVPACSSVPYSCVLIPSAEHEIIIMNTVKNSNSWVGVVPVAAVRAMLHLHAGN